MRSDVVLIGGGPAGAACAFALARGGARCILLERSPSPGWKAGEVIDARVQAPLRELGVWEELASRGYLRSAGTISAWGPEVEEKSAAASPYGGSFLVDRADLESMLLGAAARAGALVLQGTQAQAVERAGSEWLIHVRRGSETPRVLRTPLLIEAMGRGRSFTGTGERVRVDSLAALMAYPPADPVPDLRFAIEAVPGGWWYAAALPRGRAVLAFMTDADLLPAGSAEREQFFLQQLERSPLMRSRFSPASLTGLRVAPAMSAIRRTLSGDGWVALGDAAATYDPLTGTGVTVALSKGLALARLLLSEPGTAAFARYAEAERAAFDDYLKVRRSIYQGEPRWPDAPFWQRRTAAWSYESNSSNGLLAGGSSSNSSRSFVSNIVPPVILSGVPYRGSRLSEAADFGTQETQE